MEILWNCVTQRVDMLTYKINMFHIWYQTLYCSLFSFMKYAALHWLFRYFISFEGQKSDGSAGTQNTGLRRSMWNFGIYLRTFALQCPKRGETLDLKDSVTFQRK